MLHQKNFFLIWDIHSVQGSSDKGWPLKNNLSFDSMLLTVVLWKQVSEKYAYGGVPLFDQFLKNLFETWAKQTIVFVFFNILHSNPNYVKIAFHPSECEFDSHILKGLNIQLIQMEKYFFLKAARPSYNPNFLIYCSPHIPPMYNSILSIVLWQILILQNK